MNAAQRLIEVRNIFHMNQSEFSKKTGITGSLISQMERGRAGVSWKTAHTVEDTLGINADWLMTGEGEVVSDQRVKAGFAGLVAVADRYPAVAELMRVVVGRLTLSDWEALNGICERVLGKRPAVLDLAGKKRLGA